MPITLSTFAKSTEVRRIYTYRIPYYQLEDQKTVGNQHAEIRIETRDGKLHDVEILENGRKLTTEGDWKLKGLIAKEVENILAKEAEPITIQVIA